MNIAYPFRVTDNSGTPVSGATIAIGSTTLATGAATSVPAAAGEKVLTTGAAPSAAVSLTLLDFGTGDYAILSDPAVNGELYLPLMPSKSGSTITGGNALIALVASADPSNAAAAVANTAALITGQAALTAGQTTITGKTNLIGTNAGDSANTIAAQGTVSTNLDAKVSTRSVYAGGAVASVTGSVGSVTAPVMASSVTAPVSLSTADESKIGQIGADTPGTASLLARPAQTGDTFALVNPLVSAGKFTAAALSNAPTSTGGGGSSLTDSSVTADVASALGTAAIPAATIAAMKSDAVLKETFNRTEGKYTYNEATHVMTLLNDDNSVYMTLTLTIDTATSTITGKQ